MRLTLSAVVLAAGLASLGSAAQAAPASSTGIAAGYVTQVQMDRRMMRREMMKRRMMRREMMKRRMMRRGM